MPPICTVSVHIGGHRDIFLDAGELVIFEFQLIAYIHAKGQQCDGDLGDNARYHRT